MDNKQLILVDDHVIVRNGLKELIEKLGPYTVAQEFDSGMDFLVAVKEGLRPDLVLMDLNMPGMNGDEVVVKIRELGFNIPILILTLNSEESVIIKLFRNGVRGFLKKDCRASELRAALETILAGGYFHNEFLTLSLQTDSTEVKLSEKDKIISDLTDREKLFLKLVCNENEFTYEQIADKMGITVRTVDGIREGLFDKYTIRSKTGLVLFVLKNQLMEDL